MHLDGKEKVGKVRLGAACQFVPEQAEKVMRVKRVATSG
jgi:hypothetical protein